MSKDIFIFSNEYLKTARTFKNMKEVGFVID
jgi:hypothetical protein